ncbi:redoxin [Wenjunlia vitaminophila]|uniref:Redoxin n=1 Tax=Wenjunlia vitaminophila TaxID=76728 RepID=A0A0T6LYV5_WENVI|nr:TlpA disulfide reductase family protein [Wenjunlia vitaminophila]KRV50911.1 redoxin [Wenjunlia vitaminophila]
MSVTPARRSRAHRAVALSGAVAVAMAVVAGCSTANEASGGEGQGFVSGDVRVDQYSPGERKDAPELSGKTLQGEPLDLADYRGKVVVLNVWGSWCAPCRAEAKHLKKVSEETADQGVQFIGINTRDTNANARAFERNHEITFPSVSDRYGKLVARFRGSVPPSAIPTTLVIDRQGRIAARVLNAVSDKELRKMLTPLIAERT